MTHLFRNTDPGQGPGLLPGPLPGPLLGSLVLGAALLSAACADDDDPSSNVRTPTVARFAPSAGSIPIPNDLLFSGSTDVTLNLPAEDPGDGSDPFVALNTLDGWSTVAPAVIEFTRPLDPSTVIGGSSVRVFEVTAFADPTTPVGGPVLSVDNELVAGVDYEVSLGAALGDTDVRNRAFGTGAIVIQPLVPFAPSTVAGGNNVYMVVVTDAVQDTDGVAVARDAEYRFASEQNLNNPPPDLAQLNVLINSQLDAYEVSSGAPRSEVVVSFTFTTQSVGAALNTVLGIAGGFEGAIISTLCAQLGTCGMDTDPDPLNDTELRTVATAPLIGTASELLGGAPGNANVYAGIFKAPYYLTQATNTGSFGGLTNDPAPLNEPWSSRYAQAAGVTDRHVTRFNPLPDATSAQQMPMLVSIPDSGAVPMPPGGYPIAIFQHGIGGSRASMLFVAERLAAQGLACIAIDLPLHGVAPGELLPDGTTSLFLGYDQGGDVWERTFGLDLLTEGTATTFGPDGTPDSSGAHFINIADLAVSRDNVRQGIADLINLKAALSDLLITGMDVIDETQVHFIGHSFGGMVGTGFVGIQSDLTAATFAMPGASIPYLLDDSVTFGPPIQGGLAAAGVAPGTADYARFLAAAQTVVDTVDPINYAALVQANGTPVYLAEVIGGGANMSPPDLVIPNSVAGAPFAGTEPLISTLGLTGASASTFDPGGLQVAVRFIEGNHGSLLLPTTPGETPTAEEQAAWDEMQAQIATFHDLDGTTLTVTDGTVIQ